jgi:uncharacterized delta-60 repeat protein
MTAIRSVPTAPVLPRGPIDSLNGHYDKEVPMSDTVRTKLCRSVLVCLALASLSACLGIFGGGKTDLSSLGLTAGTLSPAFDPDTTSYEVTLPPAAASVSVTATPVDSASTVRARVNSGGWEALTAGTASAPLPLSFGDNTLEVEVTSTAGSSRLYELLVQRIIPGTIDSSFLPGEITTRVLGGGSWPLALLADGKILVAGYYSAYADAARAGIARLNSDGSVDLAFCAPASISSVGRLAVQADGRILIAGPLDRLNSDGTQDTSFDTGSGLGGSFAGLSCIAVQPDGKILIGGYFDSYAGTARKNIARLNADGAIDTSFDPGTVMTSIPVYETHAIALQPDGRILVGGNWSTEGTHGGIARLNSDGSLDTSFDVGTGADADVCAIVVQDDGKVVVGGWFSAINGTARIAIARLNADGSLDATFDPGAGATSTFGTTGRGSVNAIAIQPGGRVIIGGWFTLFNGTARSNLARLNPDGSLDPTFDAGETAGTGVDTEFVQALALQSDGKLLLSGYFWLYWDLPNIVSRVWID